MIDRPGPIRARDKGPLVLAAARAWLLAARFDNRT